LREEEPESHALAWRLRREERLADVHQELRSDATPLVADLESKNPTLRANANDDGSAVFARLEAIHDEPREDLRAALDGAAGHGVEIALALHARALRSGDLISREREHGGGADLFGQLADDRSCFAAHAIENGSTAIHFVADGARAVERFFGRALD